jgi:hypothetical protein
LIGNLFGGDKKVIEGAKSEEASNRIHLPVLKIVAVLPPLQNGNRVYLLDGSDLPNRGLGCLKL